MISALSESISSYVEHVEAATDVSQCHTDLNTNNDNKQCFSDIDGCQFEDNSMSAFNGLTRKKRKSKLNNLSIEGLRLEYVKQRKRRKRDKKHYKRMSLQFHQTITKTADDYEDELKQNEIDLTQEYELKLIKAEIKHNEFEQKITALNAHIKRLQYLLNDSQSTQSMFNMHSEYRPSPQTTKAEYSHSYTNLMSISSSSHNEVELEHDQSTTTTTTSKDDDTDIYREEIISKKNKKRKGKTIWDSLIDCVTPKMCDYQQL